MSAAGQETLLAVAVLLGVALGVGLAVIASAAGNLVKRVRLVLLLALAAMAGARALHGGFGEMITAAPARGTR